MSTLLGKTAWSGAGGFASAASGFLVGVLLARTLGPERLGEVAFAQWVALTAGQALGLALPQAAMRYLPATTDELALRGLAARIARAGLFFASAAGLLTAGVLAATGRAGPLAAAAAVLACTFALGAVGQALLAGAQSFRRQAGLASASAVVQLAAAAFGSVWWGPAGAVAGLALGQLVLALPLACALRDPAPGTRLPDGFWRFSRHAWLALLVSLFVWSRLELAFLERAHGAVAVALYSTALTVTLLATQATSLLGGALLPHLAEAFAAGRDEEGRTSYAAATRLLAFVSFPLCFGLAAIAPAIVPLVFGRAFDAAARPAVVLLVFAAAGAVASPGSALLYALGRSRFIAVGGLAFAAAAVAIYLAVIPQFGVMGAAVARSLVQIASVVAGTLYITFALRARVPLGKVGRSATAAAVAALVAALVLRAAGGGWGAIAMAGGALAVAYALLAGVLKVLAPEDASYLAMRIAALPLVRRVLPPAAVRALGG